MMARMLGRTQVTGCPRTDADAPARPPVTLKDVIRSGEARRLRLASGISGKAMAAGLGITKGALANIEAGRRAPGPDLAARYLRVLRGLANHHAVSRGLAVEERLRAG